VDQEGFRDGSSSKGLVEKRLSKAEVLDLARRQIRALEKEGAMLERQKRELSSTMVWLQQEWTMRLGGKPFIIGCSGAFGIDDVRALPRSGKVTSASVRVST
jgi:hypothetical protein